jgi:hypothetical protein
MNNEDFAEPIILPSKQNYEKLYTELMKKYDELKTELSLQKTELLSIKQSNIECNFSYLFDILYTK